MLPSRPWHIEPGRRYHKAFIRLSLLREWVLRAESSKIRVPEEKPMNSRWKPKSSPGCLSFSLIVQLLLGSLKCIIIIIIIYLSSLKLFSIIAIRISLRKTQIHSLTQFTTPCGGLASAESQQTQKIDSGIPTNQSTQCPDPGFSWISSLAVCKFRICQNVSK